jgi:hypothetical protein
MPAETPDFSKALPGEWLVKKTSRFPAVYNRVQVVRLTKTQIIVKGKRDVEQRFRLDGSEVNKRSRWDLPDCLLWPSDMEAREGRHRQGMARYKVEVIKYAEQFAAQPTAWNATELKRIVGEMAAYNEQNNPHPEP